MIYTAIYEREDDGRYSVHVPDLPGCAAWGSTLVEAQERIAEAITGWIETARAEGMPIPESRTLAAPVESVA
jgi:antitoxin HicB